MDSEKTVSALTPASTQRVPVIWILGDADRAEMKPIIAWMSEQILPGNKSAFVRDINDIDNHLSEDQFPDLIVVLQSWSDEYSSDDVHRLLSFAPLARVVACYGSWCESDGRNRNLWPLSIRTPAWAALSRIQREWRSITNPNAAKPLPWSASREETFAEDHSDDRDFFSISNDSGARTFLVDSPDIAFKKSVDDLLLSNGHREDPSNPDLILFDVDPWNEQRQQAFEKLRTSFPQSQFAILTNCIDRSSFAEFQRMGVNRVFHKLGLREQFNPVSDPD